MDAILANRYSVWARKPRRPPCGTSGWATNATSSSPPPGGLSFISSIVCFLDPQAFQFRSQCTRRDPEGFCGSGESGYPPLALSEYVDNVVPLVFFDRFYPGPICQLFGNVF